jgi:hypothetical protein
MIPNSHFPVNQFQPAYTDQVYYNYRHLIHVDKEGKRFLVSINLFMHAKNLVIEFLFVSSLVGKFPFLDPVFKFKIEAKICCKLINDITPPL